MTEHETLERGFAAQCLLNDPTFQSIFQELTTNAALDTFASAPQDWKKREASYHLVRAANEMIDILKGRVTVADELKAKIEAREFAAEED